MSFPQHQNSFPPPAGTPPIQGGPPPQQQFYQPPPQGQFQQPQHQGSFHQPQPQHQGSFPPQGMYPGGPSSPPVGGQQQYQQFPPPQGPGSPPPAFGNGQQQQQQHPQQQPAPLVMPMGHDPGFPQNRDMQGQGGAPPQGMFVSQQPGVNPGMSTNGAGLGGPRNALQKPVQPNGKRDWSFGLFDCFGDMGACFMSCCCPCIQYGSNMSRLQALNASGKPHPGGGDSCNGDCAIFCALLYCLGAPCLVQMGGRQRVRERYNIEGDGGNDFLCTWCCGCCALIQESRELELEEKVLTGQPLPTVKHKEKKQKEEKQHHEKN